MDLLSEGRNRLLRLLLLLLLLLLLILTGAGPGLFCSWLVDCCSSSAANAAAAVLPASTCSAFTSICSQ
jgi:hypothetical protein